VRVPTFDQTLFEYCNNPHQRNKITSSIQNHDDSVEGDLANANSVQTVLYFFLLMLYRTSTCKIFWLCAVGFFSQLLFI
jgi:hypothetical protein